MAKNTKKIELIAGYWTLAGDCYAMGPSEVSPIPLRERVEAASWAGYIGMGLVHQDLLANAKAMGYPAMKRMLGDNGIRHVDIEFLGDWFKTGKAKKASDKVRMELLEAASELGAKTVKVAGEMWAEDCDIAKMGHALASVCEDAREIGLEVALEILPMSNVRKIGTALGILAEAGQPNAGLCVDIWHFVRGGIDFAKIAALPAQYLKIVELNDAAAKMKGTMWDDTLFRRLYPGEGSFDCPGFIAAVDATGWKSPYSVEIINETYRKLPQREQAKRSFDGTMAQFAGRT